MQGVVNAKSETTSRNMSRVGRRSLFFTLEFIALAVINILLPVERGLKPLVSVGKFRMDYSTVIALFAFLTVILTVRGALRISSYVFLQILFCVSLVITTLLTQQRLITILTSGYIIFGYFVVHGLLYLILSYMVQRGMRERMTLIVVLVGILAALVGIFEYFDNPIGFYLGIYRQAFSAELYQNYFTYGYNRLLGTLGNPILYSTTICLIYPFVLELRASVLVRLAIVALLVWVSILTNARTVFVLWAILGIGTAVTLIHKTHPLILMMIPLIIVGLAIVSTDSIDPSLGLSDTINQIIYRDDLRNIDTRLALSQRAIDIILSEENPLSIVFGRGLREAGSVVTSEFGSTSLNTIDNNLLSLLFETGFSGLFFYLAAFGAILIRHIDQMRTSVHWWAVLALMATGISFVTFRYESFNFLMILSLSFISGLSLDGAITAQESSNSAI
jgi:hypothetical protein